MEGASNLPCNEAGTQGRSDSEKVFQLQTPQASLVGGKQEVNLVVIQPEQRHQHGHSAWFFPVLDSTLLAAKVALSRPGKGRVAWLTLRILI